MLKQQKFVHLHVHDEYSVLDGFGRSEDYAMHAKELGFTHLAMTNHGNIDGLIVFQKACKEQGIKPIFGCECYIVEDILEKKRGEKRKHVNILVKNKIGWENLLKLLTISNLKGFYYRPRISPAILLEYSEGLIITTACCSSFVMDEWGEKLAFDIWDKIGGDFYFEIMPHKLEEQEKLHKKILELLKKIPAKVIATNDCHYVKEDQEKAQEVLLAVQSKKKWSDKDRFRFTIKGLHLRTFKEMMKAFRKQKSFPIGFCRKALLQTVEVSKKCENFEIEEIPVNLPEIPILQGEDDSVAITRICFEEFEKRIVGVKRNAGEYKERLDFELSQVIEQGFSRYFLIVWELIKWSRENGIMVGPGRGSSSGSLVCYLLGIVTVDPIEFDLLFARFISPARIDLPDIDMDFEDRKRVKIRKHLEDLYGLYNVAGVSTFSRMKGKGAIRDVSRVFDIPMKDVNSACDCILTRSGGDERSNYTIIDAFESFEDGISFKNKYPEVVDISILMEGQIRHKGQHAAAMCISKDDLRKGLRANLQNGKSGEYVVNWEKYDIESQGIMKLDVLGLNALTVLSEIKALVKEKRGVDIDFESIPLDDKRCFKEFSAGNNIGCFQVGSLGLSKYCKQLKIEDFNMLVNATSLYRPGTLRNGMATEFIRRKRGESEIDYIHPALKVITEDTLGIILYQEQIMKFTYDLAGLEWKTCDVIRKVISKSQGDAQFMKFKEAFADGCVRKGTFDRETAENLWSELASFGSYSFNKSHAVAYSMITYWDMWCKVNYPEEFICSSLTFCGEDKKPDIIREAYRLGLEVRPPKVGKSKAKDWFVDNKVLYTPFIEIKGLGERTCGLAESYSETKGYFEESKKLLPKRFVEIFNKIDAFRDVSYDDDFAESIEEYFKFTYVRNPARKYKKILEYLNIDLSELGDINYESSLKKEKYFFVKFTEIRFSYKGDKSGAMVYGYCADTTSSCMIIFDKVIYHKKKEEIEHAEDRYAIVKVNGYTPNYSAINCNDVFFDTDLFEANFDFDIDLIKSRRFSNKKLRSCELCEECITPIMPRKGKYNIMVVSEYPFDDSLYYNCFWKALQKEKIGENCFQITSVMKSKLKGIRSPGVKYINNCGKWLTEEIERIKPPLILAMGKSSLKYFTGEDSGIIKKNGTTEWFQNIGAWVCWCISPASTVYDNNLSLFKKGMDNFFKKLRNIGF